MHEQKHEDKNEQKMNFSVKMKMNMDTDIEINMDRDMDMNTEQDTGHGRLTKEFNITLDRLLELVSPLCPRKTAMLFSEALNHTVALC
jgi:hypothetical protein